MENHTAAGYHNRCINRHVGGIDLQVAHLLRADRLDSGRVSESSAGRELQLTIRTHSRTHRHVTLGNDIQRKRLIGTGGHPLGSAQYDRPLEQYVTLTRLTAQRFSHEAAGGHRLHADITR